MNRRGCYSNRYAVTPVVGTTVIVGIMLVTSAVIWGWGIPMINDKQAFSEAQRAETEMKIMQDSLKSQVGGTEGSTFTGQLTVGEKNTMTISEYGNRLVPYYSTEDGYEIGISGLDDDDNEFELVMLEGEATKAVVHWDTDSVNWNDCEPAEIITGDATTTKSSAVIRGVIDVFGNSDSLDVGFEWGLDSSYGNSTDAGIKYQDDVDLSFFAELTDLEADTTYHYRAVCSGCESSYGLDSTFTTLPESDPDNPEVETQGKSNIVDMGSVYQLDLNGYLYTGDYSPPFDVYFKYGTSSSNLDQISTISQSNGGAFSITIGNIQPNIRYYYKAYAEDELAGTFSGDTENFIISEDPEDPPYVPPVIHTLSVGSISLPDENNKCQVYLQGQVSSIGSEDGISAWFSYWKTCFIGGSKVTMVDGSLKNIEEINIGDLVKSYDFESGEIKNGKVIKIIHHSESEMGSFYLNINDILGVTPEHLIYVNGEWLPAGDIKIGDKLKAINGSDVLVESIEKVYLNSETYNIEIENYHNYFVENLLVHNEKSSYYETTEVYVDKYDSFPYNFEKMIEVNCGTSWEYKLKAYASKIGEFEASETYSFETSSCPCNPLEVTTLESYFWNPLTHTIWMDGYLDERDCEEDGVRCWFVWEAKRDSDGVVIDSGTTASSIVMPDESQFFSITDTISSGVQNFYVNYVAWAEGLTTGSIVQGGTQTADPDILPGVKTLDNEINADNSVTLKGELTNPGDDDTAEVWFYYWGGGIGGQDTAHEADVYPGIFMIDTISNLPDGDYYYRAYAKNSVGTSAAMNGDKTFSIGSGDTDCTLANVYTGSPDTTETTATLKGDLGLYGHDENGNDYDIVTAYFKYGEDSNLDKIPDNGWQNTGVSFQMQYPMMHFEDTISGLTPDTWYVFRTYAGNGCGLAEGSKVNFKTQANDPDPIDIPSVSTSSAQRYLFDHSKVKLKGSINDDGGEHCTCGFYWSNYNFGCFLAGTKINMADRTTKNIEDIAVGDWVKAYDSENNRLVDSRVTEVFQNIKKEDYTSSYLIVNNLLKVTPVHKIMLSDSGWISSESIMIGDTLKTIDGEEIIVHSIDHVKNYVPTYNFEVEKYHNYYAEGILVHNAGSGGSNWKQTKTCSGEYWDAFGHRSFNYIVYGTPGNTYYYQAWAKNSAGRGKGSVKSVTLYSCLVEGMKISMADGTLKKIEELRIGDIVKSYDTMNSCSSKGLVTQIYHNTKDNMPNDYYININNRLKLTSEHIVYVNDEWIQADNIKIGDFLKDIDEKQILVKSIEKINQNVATYNLEVEGFHNFFAEEILVHNRPYPEPERLIEQDEEYPAESTPPQVRTLNDVNQVGTQAILTGELTSVGSSGKANCYFKYKKVNMVGEITQYGPELTTTPIAKKLPSTYESYTTSLEDGNYIFCAVAEAYLNPQEKSQGSWISFSISGSDVAPSIETLEYNDDGTGNIHLEGNLLNKGTADYVITKFQWKRNYDTWLSEGVSEYIDSNNADIGYYDYSFDSTGYEEGLYDFRAVGVGMIMGENESQINQQEIDQRNEVSNSPQKTGLPTGGYLAQVFRAGRSGDLVKLNLSLNATTLGFEPIERLDANNLYQPPIPSGTSLTYSLAQTFTAENTGELSKLTLPIIGNGNSLVISVFEGQSPNADSIIASSVVTGFTSTDYTDVVVDFSSGPQVVAGNNYGIMIQSITTTLPEKEGETSVEKLDGGLYEPEPEATTIQWENSGEDTYVYGEMYSSPDGELYMLEGTNDFLFETYIESTIDMQDITVKLYEFQTVDQQVLVQNPDDPMKDATLLGTTTISNIDSLDYDWYEAVFSGSISITEGKLYAITIDKIDRGRYNWETSGSNQYSGGFLLTSADANSWTPDENNDFLFKTELSFAAPGEPDIDKYLISYGEVKQFEITPPDDSNYNQLRTDQIIVFPYKLVAESFNAGTTIRGYRPTDHNPETWNPKNSDTGDYRTQQHDENYQRPFVVTSSDKNKGICIDIFDDTDGYEKLVARIWIFNQGSISWISDVGYEVHQEGASIATSTPGGSGFIQDGPLFIKSDNSININLVQVQPYGASSKSGGSSCTLMASLKQNIVREVCTITDAKIFKMQVHGDFSDAMVDFLTKQGFVDSGYPDASNELTYSTSSSKLTISHTLFDIHIS